MKKTLIGSIVGGIIVFIWSFLSWALLNLHHGSQEYTPKQDSILAYLNTQFSDDGSYLLPRSAPGTSHEEMEKQMESRAGKPWVMIQYHKSLNVNMTENIIRGLLTDIIMVIFVCWIFSRFTSRQFGAIFTACILIGLIVFINAPYAVHIWYHKGDIWAYFLDAVVGWGLVGIWLGWYLSPKAKPAAA
ncbi:MAG TPA: hypothetical protein VG890_17930 [Puia sp.]|nr:hypothetical protein [Puia sp.]